MLRAPSSILIATGTYSKWAIVSRERKKTRTVSFLCHHEHVSANYSLLTNWAYYIIFLGLIVIDVNYNMRNNNTVQVTRWRWNQLIISKHFNYGWKGQLCCRRSDFGKRAFLSGVNLQPYFISPVENHAWPAEKRQIGPSDEMLEMRMELNLCCQRSRIKFPYTFTGRPKLVLLAYPLLLWEVLMVKNSVHVKCNSLVSCRPVWLCLWLKASLCGELKQLGCLGPGLQNVKSFRANHSNQILLIKA